jgi:hypothetical protein
MEIMADSVGFVQLTERMIRHALVSWRNFEKTFFFGNFFVCFGGIIGIRVNGVKERTLTQ